MPSVFIKTLGCKVNTYDTHVLESQFRALGYELASNAADADIAIVNTCSVTDNADKESRYLLRRYRRENPEGMVVATGCYAQTDSAAIAAMPEVNFIIPNEIKEKLPELLHASFLRQQSGESAPVSHIPPLVKPVTRNRQGHFKTSLNMITADSDQTRAFLKIQDGCNGFCAYCLIPYARGASRSVAQESVLTEVRRLIDSGIQEIVLTGIHIGDYGEDLNQETSLVGLLQEMFDWPDMVRLRISSLEPRELTEGLLKVLATRPDLACDHFHLPLQSGSERILKRMRRTYTAAEYAEKVAMARAYFPDAGFGADVIPGFPGETMEEAQETEEFIKRTGLHYLHVFPYSRRPNTAADKMPDHVAPEVVRERAASLTALGKDLKFAYQSRFLGRTVSVLWEHTKDKAGRHVGKTSNYLDVAAASASTLAPNTFSWVKLKGLTEEGRILGIPMATPVQDNIPSLSQ